MTHRLNRRNLAQLPPGIKKPLEHPGTIPAILHFGAGAFHRSHQASYFQRLIDRDPEKYGSWSVAGACIMPHDKAFVENMRNQDCLYTLKTSGEGREEVRVISSITQLFFGPAESEQIIERIASAETKIISFTITEGGYMLDEASGKFRIDHPAVAADLAGDNVPKTIYGYLARGLARRRERGGARLILLSCDNVQENGQVLQRALLAFLDAYDRDLKAYVLEHVSFPSSMVDRITPVTTSKDKDRFEMEFGYRDECLVVSENFSQWIMEETRETEAFPLREVGVSIVKDVRPYEKMKLQILNGAHSLVGLVGKALGYEYIHAAIRDDRISRLFDLYIEKEVMPGLDEIEDVSYTRYMNKVKSRFGHELILDSTDRIISFSSAKIPKFILPVLEHSIAAGRSFLISTLIIAAWWHYLKEQVSNGRSAEIEDDLKDHWGSLFRTPGGDPLSLFLATREVFGDLATRAEVREQVNNLTEIIDSEGMERAVKFAVDGMQ